jgi:selenocysteine lyase/cysteine desulfurase
MEAREGVKLRLIAPSAHWIKAEDFIAALTPRTRVVSASMVRFDDGSMLEAAKLGAACRRQGSLLALDVCQLGVDFITCSGYKWLLGPYGSGFFWGKSELLASVRPGPFYWQGIEDMNDYSELVFENPKAASGARGWDAAETASYFNLAGWDASLRFLEQVGVATVAAHNRARTPEQTKEFYERLRKAKVFASLREGNIRVSTHLYNTEQDIDKLVEVIAR